MREQGDSRVGKKYQCDQCILSFDVQWRLNQHKKRAHEGRRNRICNSIAGILTCRVCAEPQDNLWSLKKHVFFMHSELDVQAQYGESIERYIGTTYMQRFRKILQNQIMNG